MDDYIRLSGKVASETLDENGSIIQALRTYHDYFAKFLWAAEDEQSPVSVLLAMNAFMLHSAAIRTAMSGHAVAAFPILRTALEAACYSFLMTRNSELESIWINRRKGESEFKLCRRRFTPAVREAVKLINLDDPKSANWILDAYEQSIDFGAHPNARSIFNHVSLSETDADAIVTFTGIYSSKSFETFRSLFACLDFGLAIAVILTVSLENPSEGHQAKLFELNDLKNKILSEFKNA